MSVVPFQTRSNKIESLLEKLDRLRLHILRIQKRQTEQPYLTRLKQQLATISIQIETVHHHLGLLFSEVPNVEQSEYKYLFQTFQTICQHLEDIGHTLPPSPVLIPWSGTDEIKQIEQVVVESKLLFQDLYDLTQEQQPLLDNINKSLTTSKEVIQETELINNKPVSSRLRFSTRVLTGVGVSLVLIPCLAMFKGYLWGILLLL
jgi:hypothetical protein